MIRVPIILTLLFAAALSFFLRDVADASIILAIVLITGLLGFWQDKGAADAVNRLLDRDRTLHPLLTPNAEMGSLSPWQLLPARDNKNRHAD